MANTEKRIEKLEGMYRPQRQLRPSLVMLDENGNPVNEYYAKVLRLAQEAKACGEDVELHIFRLPAQELQKGVKQEVEQ